ncbi:MAG: zinc-ribbon and DUF3426 domain-containing protein [Methylomonas sp.]
MYSRCSHCQAQQQVTAEQLRRSRGLLSCSACGKRFDALASLSEQVDAQLQAENTADFLPDLTERKPASGVWVAASALMAVAFLAQIVYFEGDALNRQPQLHAGLQAVCERLKCRLPAYKNIDEWSVSHSDFRKLSDKNYILSAAITNQAVFPQAYPDLKLVLLNFSGQAIAQRVFSGQQYGSAAVLPANETAEIKLSVVAPPGLAQIGGYTFSLL